LAKKGSSRGIQLKVAVGSAGTFCSFATTLVEGGKVDVYDHALSVPSPVNDEVLACPSRFRNHILNLHVVLPKLVRGPIGTFVPRVKQLVGCDAVVGQYDEPPVIGDFVNVATLRHFGPRQAAVTRQHDADFVSAIMQMVTDVAYCDYDSDRGGARVQSGDACKNKVKRLN
jgi:hypothetical protein